VSETPVAEADRVVRFHYQLTDEAGERVESSFGAEPSLALLGHGNLMGGLEAAITGRRGGERFSVTLAEDDAFGPRRDDWTQRISKKYFPKGTRFQVGGRTRVQTEQGVRTVTVLKVGNKFVDVDLNHPLAGQSVTFEVELLDVREATPEELAHGHAHGAGGHHH
jgi:FKBP-type peptidyl-prolyl cis-trans isomerase SlyD